MDMFESTFKSVLVLVHIEVHVLICVCFVLGADPAEVERFLCKEICPQLLRTPETPAGGFQEKQTHQVQSTFFVLID